MRPAIIFIHGLGDDSTAWRSLLQQPQFAGLQVSTPDLPGFGATPWSGESIEDTAASFAAQIEKFDCPVVVVGHSRGGVIATLIAEKNPQNLVGIVNVEGNLTEADCFLSREIANLKEVGGWIEAYRTKWPDRYIQAVEQADPAAFVSAARDLVRLSGDDLARRYSSLMVPHLYVMGTVDSTEETRLSLAATEQNVEIFTDAGHWVMEERPKAFAELLFRWVERGMTT